MTDICPLYRDAIEANPWQNAQTANTTANTGLLFDKFANAWGSNRNKWEFDKGSGQGGDSGKWLKNFARKCGDEPMLSEACRRQQDLIAATGGVLVCLKNTSRFLTGLGREHPLENGFAWHPTLGTPYLPGSSGKGLLRAWLREEGLSITDIDAWFGKPDQSGRFALLDMIPAAPPQLVVEIMTPHYGPYYQQGKAPGDWHSPVPIPLLAVESGAVWQLGIIPLPGKAPLQPGEIRQLRDHLIEALKFLGAGAKTAVGYGRFEHDQETERKIDRDAERRRQEMAAHRAREAELAKLTPELADLHRRVENEAWGKDNGALLTGIEGYLAAIPNPPAVCIEYLRSEWLEKAWPGLWANPDAVEGKKKKPQYKDRPRALAKALKSVSAR